MVKVCCLGAGYVGGPTMAVMAYKCPDVNFFVLDVDEKKIDAWNSMCLPIYEPGLLEIVKVVIAKNLVFSNDIKTHLSDADIIFVAVGTPSKQYGIGANAVADMKHWESATRLIGEALLCKPVQNRNPIIVEKSTVPIGTASNMYNLLEEYHYSGEILSNPEFLAEGTAINDLLNPDRVLIGARNTIAGNLSYEILANLYSKWVCKTKILRVGVWSSELSKLVANAFLAQKLASINSISLLCEKINKVNKDSDLNIVDITNAIGTDTRIGNKFLQPSFGFGGSCFKKDVLSLVYICESMGLPYISAYWSYIMILNDHSMNSFVARMFMEMYTLNGKKIAIFGFGFKKNTGDIRESPAITVCNNLLMEGAQLSIYDPKVKKEDITRSLHTTVDIKSNPLDCAYQADAIVILTEWEEFKDYDYSTFYNNMRRPSFIFDGRGILSDQLKKIGFKYFRIGM